ncbi:hypothetical protein OG203_26955 [Nocardia sp. NBC_01499]|uniref:hypothetical protein n=1 Tax=Nocardia sp. NBC_01499 TaxID=2903597 RepID=UPI003865E9D6
MNDRLEYFVEAAPPYTADRPESLWRRLGDHWEYLSLFDWRWHRPDRTKFIKPPRSEVLYPVTAERAAELAADHQVWVRYWAYYSSVYRWRAGDPPTTVIRRRNSPECQLDEGFMRDNKWHEDSAIDDFWDPHTSNPPHLIEINADEAEVIIRERRGISGAINL